MKYPVDFPPSQQRQQHILQNAINQSIFQLVNQNPSLDLNRVARLSLKSWGRAV